MNSRLKVTRATNGILALMIAGFLMPGCSQSAAPANNSMAPTTPQAAAVQNQVAPAPPVEPPSGAATSGQFEQPPIVDIGVLLPSGMQAGNGYQVGPTVPTNGAMGQYTIIADAAVFKGDAGTYQIESLNLLKIRLAEIPAIAALENMSSTGEFTKEFAQSAARPVEDAAQMVTHPMDTVTGLPSGVGQLFGRIDLGAQAVYSTATNSSESGGQRAQQVAGETGSITANALGYDQVRRDLARKLHVDPYSSDPILTRLLNHMAWVMFSARVMVNTAVSVAVPGSMLITGVEFTDDMVYQTPKGDLILMVSKKLKKMGASELEVSNFSHNPAMPLSLQVTAVHNLEALGKIAGRRSVIDALGNVITEYQARFLVTSLQMLANWSQQQSQIVSLRMVGVIMARDQSGTEIIPAPVDYISWTPRIAGFATAPELMAMQNRVLLTSAQMTPLARTQLGANGWTVREGMPQQ